MKPEPRPPIYTGFRTPPMGLLICSALLSGEPDLCLVEAHAEPVMARDDDLGGRVGDPVPAVVIGARVPPPGLDELVALPPGHPPEPVLPYLLRPVPRLVSGLPLRGA